MSWIEKSSARIIYQEIWGLVPFRSGVAINILNHRNRFGILGWFGLVVKSVSS